MPTSKLIKTILFSVVYSINILLAAALWLSGNDGNILLGIILILFYRLSLWSLPWAVTIISWLPLKPKVSIRKKLLFNFVHLIFCGILFLICYLLFGFWY